MTQSAVHPNVHAEWKDWSNDQILHVISVYSNPFRWHARRQLFNNFKFHMHQSPNVRLHVVEVAFGDRPFEVTTSDNPHDIQLRNSDVMWLKENAINIGVQRLPFDWKYAAYVDGDFHFTRHDWALEAVHKLQHHPWVQLFSNYAVMGRDGRPLQIRPSFAYAYHQYFGGSLDSHRTREHKEYHPRPNPRNTTPGATGGAWSFTRRGFDEVGGMLDRCILGAADWYMSFGLIGNTTDGHPEVLSCGRPYEDYVRRWQTRAYDALKGNIGYVENFATHAWHGDLKNRGYGNRWHILRDNHYDPNVDVIKDWQGLLKWTGDKPMFQDQVNRYFISRDEDSTESSMTSLV